VVNRSKSPSTERVPLDLFSRAVPDDDVLAVPSSGAQEQRSGSSANGGGAAQSHVCITAIADRMYGSISSDAVSSRVPSSEMRSLIGIRLMACRRPWSCPRWEFNKKADCEEPRTEQENPMWYGNTKTLLESIVRGLKAEPPQNDAEWQAQTDLVQACLAEMVELSEPTVNSANGATSRYVHRPVADKLNRAMPHVRSMLTAMRERNRATALAHGETTLQRL
jgi:hypothetical protein